MTGPSPTFADIVTKHPSRAFPETMRHLQVEGKPAPAPRDPRKRTVWVVQQISGGRLRILAEWHSSTPRTEGTELRFYNREGADGQHRVATVRAGSWHWCVEESALDPKEVES